MTFDLNKLTANPDLSFKPEGTASEAAANVSTATPSAFDTLIKSYNTPATPTPPVVQPRQPDPVQATRTIQSGDSNPDDDAYNDADNFPTPADAAPHLAQANPPKAQNVKDSKAPATAKTAEAKPAATTAAATATAAPAITTPDAKAATATQTAATLLAGLIGVQQTAQPAAPTAATANESQLPVDANGKTAKPDAKAAAGKDANGKTPVAGDDGQDNGPAAPATIADAKSAFDAALAKVKADLSGGQDKNSSSQDQSATASATLVTPASTSVTTLAPAFSFVSDTVVPPTYAQTGATDANGTATGMSQVAVDTMSNLSLQISKRLTDGNTRFNLELHPADLGRVDVALTIGSDGKTSAHLSFDSPVTAARFSANESELRNQLSQAGLNVSSDGLSFTSRNEGTAMSDSAMQQGFQQNAQNQGHAYRDDARQQTPASSGADSIPAIASADTDIDTYLAGLTGAATTTGRLALNLIV